MKEKINLGLMVFNSAQELGNKVNQHLLEKYSLTKEDSFLIPMKENFFEDGHLKVELDQTVRGKDIYLLTDIGNYGVEYKIHGFINHASPNDLMMQLKDGIGACNRQAQAINIVMPLLYAGRQHRRNTRENLMCGLNLHELDNLSRIKTFITFDAHDQGVEHAVNKMEFDNFYVTNTILENLIQDLTIEQLKNIVFVAPDTGATGRRNVYLNSFNTPYINREAGSFIKQRDYNHVVDGKNPIIAHEYCGNRNLKGYTALVIDDMISSGSSMYDVIDELIKYQVKYIYIITTFALFTKGPSKFDEYYKQGKLSGIYITNLSYIPKEYTKYEWLHICDCSKLIADIIYSLHNDIPISPILTDKSQPIKMLEEKFKNSK